MIKLIFELWDQMFSGAALLATPDLNFEKIGDSYTKTGLVLSGAGLAGQ